MNDMNLMKLKGGHSWPPILCEENCDMLCGHFCPTWCIAAGGAFDAGQARYVKPHNNDEEIRVKPQCSDAMLCAARQPLRLML